MRGRRRSVLPSRTQVTLHDPATGDGGHDVRRRAAARAAQPRGAGHHRAGATTTRGCDLRRGDGSATRLAGAAAAPASRRLRQRRGERVLVGRGAVVRVGAGDRRLVDHLGLALLGLDLAGVGPGLAGVERDGVASPPLDCQLRLGEAQRIVRELERVAERRVAGVR